MNPQAINPGGYRLDASVLIGYLRQENGGEALLDYIASGVPLLVSPTNLVEVYGVLIGHGEFTQAQVEGGLELLLHLFEPLDSAHVAAAGALLGRSKSQCLNLSLGDCLCLSVAAQSGTVALTTDRAWQTLADSPTPVELIQGS